MTECGLSVLRSSSGLIAAACLACLSWLGGCAALDAALEAAVGQPNDRASRLLAEQGFGVLPLRADTLAAIARHQPDTQWLTVFIEGDGAAWPLPWQPPSDPTPSQPIALHLALAHLPMTPSGEAVAYLGRPCQYLDKTALAGCPPAWWTLARFGAAPLAKLNARLDDLKAKAPQASLRLVGYSGGGAVAALLASQRADVSCLVTVAAPLDTDAWTRAKHVSPLSQSLNPLDVAATLHGTAMTHFAGSLDNTVPTGVNSRFLAAAKSSEVIQAGFSHEGPWAKAWLVLAGQSCLAKTPP